MNNDTLRKFAIIGAGVRVAELNAELSALLVAFPEAVHIHRNDATAPRTTPTIDDAAVADMVRNEPKRPRKEPQAAGMTTAPGNRRRRTKAERKKMSATMKAVWKRKRAATT